MTLYCLICDQELDELNDFGFETPVILCRECQDGLRNLQKQRFAPSPVPDQPLPDWIIEVARVVKDLGKDQKR
jgi:hypothetical protein